MIDWCDADNSEAPADGVALNEAAGEEPGIAGAWDADEVGVVVAPREVVALDRPKGSFERKRSPFLGFWGLPGSIFDKGQLWRVCTTADVCERDKSAKQTLILDLTSASDEHLKQKSNNILGTTQKNNAKE
jgi:hypothetical protein